MATSTFGASTEKPLTLYLPPEQLDWLRITGRAAAKRDAKGQAEYLIEQAYKRDRLAKAVKASPTDRAEALED